LAVFREELPDISHNLRYALLFLQNARGELFGRQMCDVFLGARVLAVEVATIGDEFGGGNFPGALVLFAFVPPRHERREILELDRRGLGVVLPAFGQRLFVIPDFARRSRAVEEQDVRGNAGVRREHAIGQAHDGVQVEFLEQLFLDARTHTIAEQRAVGNDNCRTRGKVGRVCPSAPLPIITGRRGEDTRPTLRNFLISNCKNSSAVSLVCLSSGKLP
jgi:hypothetical protein